MVRTASLALALTLAVVYTAEAAKRSNPYTCPARTWIKCKPKAPKHKYCGNERFLEWAKKNCPGFQGKVS